MPPERTIAPFDPRAELAANWPEWTVHVTHLHGVNEVLDSPRRVILLDLDDDPEDWALSHALAHLELGHHLGDGPLSDEHEADASWLGRLWLGVFTSSTGPWMLGDERQN